MVRREGKVGGNGEKMGRVKGEEMRAEVEGGRRKSKWRDEIR